jgi:amidohydrolase
LWSQAGSLKWRETIAMKNLHAILLSCVVPAALAAPADAVRAQVSTELPRLRSLYEHLHRNPELSLLEEKTSKRLADELREAGFEVTEKVGGYGVVGVLRNGPGPAVLVRTDMDALPVKEQTGLPYASERKQVNTSGEEVSVMHACGHDMHMTVFIGAARFLATHKDQFSGTLVFIGQPAEERGMGARAMMKDGLYKRFPKPDYAVALHVNARLPAGKVAYVPGYIMANVDMVDVSIPGVGGHGAYPHQAKDPVVLASEIVLALQTLISREKPASDPGVLTVGSIHGGTKHNIIPDVVKLQITVRSYSDAVRTNLISGIERIARNLALAAGMPDDKLPTVKLLEDEFTPATYNNPELTARLVKVFESWLGKEAVEREEAQMGGEDFSVYGLTEDKVPICLLWLGAAPHARIATGEKLPSIHSPFFYPEPDLTIRTGVQVLAASVLDLLKKPL